MTKHEGNRTLSLPGTPASGMRNHGWLRNECGQALVEFALVMVMLFLLVLGIVDFGIAFNNYVTLTHATDVSARLLAISRGQTTDPCDTAVQAFYASAANLNRSKLTFTIDLNDSHVGGATCSSGSTTSGAAANLIAGAKAQVTATYPCHLTFMGINFAPNCILRAQTAEVIQ